MWCFISEPNGIIHEIFLPNNAVGQECLDKVRNYGSMANFIPKDYLYTGYIFNNVHS